MSLPTAFFTVLSVLPGLDLALSLQQQQQQGEGLLPAMEARHTSSDGAVRKRQAELSALKARAEQTRRREELAAKYKDPIPMLAGCQGFECVQRYCAFDDGAFSWTVSSGPVEGPGWQRWDLQVTSQAWMTASTGALWTHHMTVIIPQSLSSEGQQAGWAILKLDGEPSSGTEEFAVRTGAVAVALENVPNQGLDFVAEGRFGLDEETLKAWSWVQSTRHPEHPEWPIEMPSVKAVVRGLDAVMAFTKQLNTFLPRVAPVEHFIVTGESKRGMATWMAGAVDNTRIQGIIPLVMPIHGHAVMNATAANIGGIEEAARPYLLEGVYDVPMSASDRLQSLIDPFHYRDHLTMPKLVLAVGNDEFFPPDASRSFYADLPEPKSFLIAGNAHHGGYDTNPFMQDEAEAFAKGLMLGSELPQVNWTVSPVSGTISARHMRGPPPRAVRLWRAKTPSGTVRDFREAAWVSAELLPATDGRWLAQVAPVPGHWTGFYIEFEYPVATELTGSGVYRLSTEVSVVPLTRPFPGASPRLPQWQRLV